ncbi:MAG: sulfotransferase [Candidatus Nitricoxidivorans perseverans]|uniref:Sulfotransferase n=1 Tax=Candidatus Nitricoxidivorans perseverans TaxID=2975601 RepID=A0AA49J044_9PROT|nr:MAG: sulfotransferase [Candidatus Nitricoxidivorans perseverans]
MKMLKKLKRKLTSSPWPEFAYQVRGTQEKLLIRLDDFPDSVLVTGCQRSGTTMLARIITQSDGMADYWFSHDDEHDAASILAGRVPHAPKGRYCFQTTYLNERYPEYAEHPGHYLVWVLRNPASVVHSMLYNWKDFALNELFLACGYNWMDHADRVRFLRSGLAGIPRIRRAAYAYNGKVSQLAEVKRNYPSERMVILEYDELVREKEVLLPRLYERIALRYRPEYAASIRAGSLKNKDGLSQDEARQVEAICTPAYQNVLPQLTLTR